MSEGGNVSQHIEDFVLRHFTVPKLKSLLKSLKLASSGNKSLLQERLLAHVQRLRDHNDTALLQQILNICLKISTGEYDLQQTPQPRTYTQQVNTLSGPPPSVTGSRNLNFAAYANLMNAYSPDFSNAGPYRSIEVQTPQGLPLRPLNIEFSESPFFRLASFYGHPVVFSGPYNHSIYSRRIDFDLDPETHSRVAQSRAKLVILSQLYQPPVGPKPIDFPYHVEIITNSKPVQANTRGVKNHRGSTPPVDISQNILRNLNKRRHTVDVRMFVDLHEPRKDDYTVSKAFAMCIALIEPRSISILVDELLARTHITEIATKEHILNETKDEDSLAMESMHSLKDPVMYSRIKVPIRSVHCNHIDCFDAEVYLQLQQQATTWKCLICNESITWGSLAVDDYFAGILDKAEADVDQVKIEPDGSWSVMSRDAADVEDSDSDFAEEPPAKKSKRQKDIPVVDLLGDSPDATDEEASVYRSPQSTSGGSPSIPRSSSQSREEILRSGGLMVPRRTISDSSDDAARPTAPSQTSLASPQNGVTPQQSTRAPLEPPIFQFLPRYPNEIPRPNQANSSAPNQPQQRENWQVPAQTAETFLASFQNGSANRSRVVEVVDLIDD